MKLYERNIALEWYQYGLEKQDDFFMRFMMHWVAFNWLYNGVQGVKSERAKINQYYENNKNRFDQYDAFSSPAIEVFLHGPVKGDEYSDSNFEGIKRRKTKKLLMTLYTVRCNLFHGSKSLRIKRDQELVLASADILEGYLNVLLNNQRFIKEKMP